MDASRPFPKSCVILAGLLVISLTGGWAAREEDPKSLADMSDKNLANMKNPIPYTRKSIARGKSFYLRYCQECHDEDGKALTSAIADATDLTFPKAWKYGVKEGEIFRSIRRGAGDEMPPFKTEIRREDDTWHVVNFIRSIGPKSLKPPLVEEPKPKEN